VIYELLKGIGAMRWSLFFLISVGRGTNLDPLIASSCERILNWLYELSQKSPFVIKTTEAHHFRRIAFQRMRQSGKEVDEILYHSRISGFGVNDGNGILFVSCTGEIFPSGFLPASAGNIRKDDLTAIYRDAPLFRAMRDKDHLKGKCGFCPYKGICGGSRSRAFAATGDYLESDPLCAYNPKEEVREELKETVGS
jgi:radical SAM protein with 4Fe4S-binding SPASM domain